MGRGARNQKEIKTGKRDASLGYYEVKGFVDGGSFHANLINGQTVAGDL